MKTFFTKAALVERLSAVVGYTLDPAQVTISDVTVNTNPATTRTTKLSATFLDESSNLITRKFYYFRLNLNVLEAVFRSSRIPMAEVGTAHDLLPYINAQLSMNLTVDDIEGTTPIIDELDESSFTLDLIAKPGSWWFTGQCQLKFGRKQPLTTNFTNVNLGDI